METEPDNSAAPAPTAKVLEGLNDLLRLEYDLIGAYRIAVEKLENLEWADEISGFLGDHERHVRELEEVILELGGIPADEPREAGPFTSALRNLRALSGDRGVLVAFRANELQSRVNYDRFVSTASGWPRDVKEVVDRSARDEDRHYQWATEVLEHLGVPPTGGADVDATSRIRAGFERLGGKLGVEELRTGLEGHARTAPLRTVLVAFAAGVLIGRILR